jgi:hypothetical protein
MTGASARGTAMTGAASDLGLGADLALRAKEHTEQLRKKRNSVSVAADELGLS